MSELSPGVSFKGDQKVALSVLDEALILAARVSTEKRRLGLQETTETYLLSNGGTVTVQDLQHVRHVTIDVSYVEPKGDEPEPEKPQDYKPIQGVTFVSRGAGGYNYPESYVFPHLVPAQGLWPWKRATEDTAQEEDGTTYYTTTAEYAKRNSDYLNFTFGARTYRNMTEHGIDPKRKARMPQHLHKASGLHSFYEGFIFRLGSTPIGYSGVSYLEADYSMAIYGDDVFIARYTPIGGFYQDTPWSVSFETGQLAIYHTKLRNAIFYGEGAEGVTKLGEYIFPNNNQYQKSMCWHPTLPKFVMWAQRNWVRVETFWYTDSSPVEPVRRSEGVTIFRWQDRVVEVTCTKNPDSTATPPWVMSTNELVTTEVYEYGAPSNSYYITWDTPAEISGTAPFMVKSALYLPDGTLQVMKEVSSFTGFDDNPNDGATITRWISPHIGPGPSFESHFSQYGSSVSRNRSYTNVTGDATVTLYTTSGDGIYNAYVVINGTTVLTYTD